MTRDADQGDACRICLNVIAASADHDVEAHADWAMSNEPWPIVETMVAMTVRDNLPIAVLYFADALGDTTMLEVRPGAALRLAAQLLQFTEDCYGGLTPRRPARWT